MESNKTSSAVVRSSNNQNRVIGLRIIAVAGGIGVLAMLSTVLWMAVSAGIAFGLLGLLGLLGIATVQALPLLGQKWENKLLADRKAEARNRPIETMQNGYRKVAERVELIRTAAVRVRAQCTSMKEVLTTRKQERPNSDYAAQEKMIAAMDSKALDLQAKYERGGKVLEQIRERIEDAQFQFDFSQEAMAGDAALHGLTDENIMDQILMGEAFKSVREDWTTVLAELEIEANLLTNAQTSNSQQLTYENGVVLDMSGFQVRDAVPAIGRT